MPITATSHTSAGIPYRVHTLTALILLATMLAAGIASACPAGERDCTEDSLTEERHETPSRGRHLFCPYALPQPAPCTCPSAGYRRLQPTAVTGRKAPGCPARSGLSPPRF